MTTKTQSTTQKEKLAHELRRTERLAPVQGGLAAGALALTVLLAVRSAALAQSPGVNLAQLAARVSALEAHASDPGPKGPTGNAGAKGTAGDKGLSGNHGTDGRNGTNGKNGKDGRQGPTGTGYTPANLAILGTFSLSGTDLTLSGANVHIVDGMGSTSSTSGLGNLIVGYNGPSSLYHQARGGSHNLIVGDANNYNSYGGVVCGDDNDVGAPYASVTGGTQNLANGLQSSISGGQNNTASGTCAAIPGGNNNTASGFYAVVSGGSGNTASAEGSAVSGGVNDSAGGLYSAVGGGDYDIASGDYSSISGGPQLLESYKYGWLGGNQNGLGSTKPPIYGNFSADKG